MNNRIVETERNIEEIEANIEKMKKQNYRLELFLSFIFGALFMEIIFLIIMEVKDCN